MKAALGLFLFAILTLGLRADESEEPAFSLYEMRTYYAAEGKRDALLDRFRNHTCALFEKHGIKNVVYLVPVDTKMNLLVYLVAYPNMAARNEAWKQFLVDPEWKKAKADSIRGGKLVRRIDSVFLTPTAYSPRLVIEDKGPDRLFELRTYSTRPGRLPALHKRFSDHTLELFDKHGMTNVVYLDLAKEQPGRELLTYLLAHEDDAARRTSWKAFRDDPAWKKARAESVKDAPILKEGGVVSVLLKPTDFSPLK